MTDVGEGSSLLGAVADGDLNLVCELLDNGADIEERDLNGQTALLLASEKGCLDIVWELLRRDANVNARDEDGWTALIASCKEGFADIAAALLENGAKPNISDMGGWTPLVWASYKGHSEVARELLRYGADANERGQHNMTALIWAAGRGHLGVVKELLEAGAKAEVCDKYGTSALIWACRKGHFEVAKELVKEGAKVDTAGTHGWTPLTMAAKGGFGDVLDLILEQRCNLNAVDQDGRSALCWAAKEGHESIVRALLNRNAYINMPDKHGETPLISASKEGYPEVVGALLSKYADLEFNDNEGKTALYHAVERGHVDVVRELLASGANTEVNDKDLETPLLRGTRRKHTQCVRLLLEKGADITATDKKGDTALHIAVRNRYTGLCEVLLKDPKNSRLLYKPNRSGETPYSIDCTVKPGVLSSIFGSRQLKTDIYKMELPSAQDSFITAVADFISEPSLSVPLTVGLYSRWGAGKSIVLQKLQDQIREYANQEAIQQFRITSGIIWISFIISITFGLVVWAAKSWDYGLLTGLAVFVIVVAVSVLARNSSRGGYGNMVRLGLRLAESFRRIALLGRLIYCVPPTTEAVRSMLPVHFLFVDLSKTVMIGDNPMTSLVNLAQELNDAVERDLGLAVPRLYRVFRAGPYRTRQVSHLNLRTKWKTSCCCVPTFSFSIIVIVFVWTGLFCFALFGTSGGNIVTGIEIATVCILGGALLCNIPRFFVIIYCLVLSMKKRVKIVSSQPGIREDTFMHVLKQEIDLYVDMLECLDGFTRRQTRVVLFLDLLDSLEQQKVLHLMNSLNLLLSEAGHPFVTVITVDPRLLLKAIDQNLVTLHDSHISAYDYLKNVVDLPCYVPEPLKGGVHGLIPQAVVSQLSDVSVSSDHDVTSTHQQELEWDGTLYDHSGGEQEDDLSQRPECNGSVPLINNNLQSNASRPVRFSNESISNSYGKPDGHWEEMQLTQSTLATHEQQRISTDLSQLLRDNESGTLSDIKRTMNIVSLMGRLLRSRNVPFRWKHLASWVSLADGWPYKVTWLTLLCEDTSLNLPQSLTLRKLYHVAGYAMPVVGDPDIGSDGDLVYFETFLGSHQPLITVGEVRNFVSSTFHIDPTIKRLMIDYLQAIKNGNISKPQSSGLGSTCITKTPNVGSPSSSRFMWKGASDDQPLLQMTVDDICNQLGDIEGIEKDHVALYQNRLRESNINGRVLAACDLNELRDAMHMNFGDWQLFKAWIYESRSREASVTPRAGKKSFLTYHSSHPGTPVDGSRSASTSEPPMSPTGRNAHDTPRSGGEQSGTATEGEDVMSVEGNMDSSKSPYGSHMYRQVATRPRDKQGKQRTSQPGPSRQRTDDGGHVVIIHGATKKALVQAANSRQLNTWQRSADSGFASTEVDGQQRSRTLLRQTSVQEGRENECESEKHDMDSSKTSSRSDLREYEDDNMTCSSKDNFEDSVTSQGTIPEIQVQIASPRTGSSQDSHDIEYFQPPPALADELRDILSSLPDSAAVVLTGAEECTSDPCNASSPANLLRNALASPEKIVVVRRASLGGGMSDKIIENVGEPSKPPLSRRSSEGVIHVEQKSTKGSRGKSRGHDYSDGRATDRRQRSRDNEPFRELVTSIKEELSPCNGDQTMVSPRRPTAPSSPRSPRTPYHQRAYTTDAVIATRGSPSLRHDSRHQRSKTVDACVRQPPISTNKGRYQVSEPNMAVVPHSQSSKTQNRVSSQGEISRKRRKEHVSNESLTEDLPHPPKSLLDYRSSVESPLPSPPPKEMLKELESSDSETFPSPPREVIRKSPDKPLIKSKSADSGHQTGSPRLDSSRPVPPTPPNSFMGTVRVEKRKPDDRYSSATGSLPNQGFVRSQDQLPYSGSESRTININASRFRHNIQQDHRSNPGDVRNTDDSLWLPQGGSLKKTWPSRGKSDRNHSSAPMSGSRTSLPTKSNDKETML